MRNKTLHKRLTAIEVKSDQLAREIENERISSVSKNLSLEAVKQAYQQMIAAASKPDHDHSKEGTKLTAEQAFARYQRLCRG